MTPHMELSTTIQVCQWLLPVAICLVLLPNPSGKGKPSNLARPPHGPDLARYPYCLQLKPNKTVSNLAWGLIGQGFLSHGSFNWLHKFLRTLDRVYHEHGQDTSIDFLFPSCKDDSIRLPIQAMQHAECLYFLRKYLRIFWHKSSSEDVTLSAQSYTVHGLKSTLLSYAAQLQLPDEMRRIQGKHRAVQASTRLLYSRDDVSAALRLQQIIRMAGGVHLHQWPGKGRLH